jgi:hypothetical protein
MSARKYLYFLIYFKKESVKRGKRSVHARDSGASCTLVQVGSCLPPAALQHTATQALSRVLTRVV